MMMEFAANFSSFPHKRQSRGREALLPALYRRFRGGGNWGSNGA
jgi:hypothetical protein